jgi:hypothetical protein
LMHLVLQAPAPVHFTPRIALAHLFEVGRCPLARGAPVPPLAGAAALASLVLRAQTRALAALASFVLQA